MPHALLNLWYPELQGQRQHLLRSHFHHKWPCAVNVGSVWNQTPAATTADSGHTHHWLVRYQLVGQNLHCLTAPASTGQAQRIWCSDQAPEVNAALRKRVDTWVQCWSSLDSDTETVLQLCTSVIAGIRQLMQLIHSWPSNSYQLHLQNSDWRNLTVLCDWPQMQQLMPVLLQLEQQSGLLWLHSVSAVADQQSQPRQVLVRDASLAHYQYWVLFSSAQLSENQWQALHTFFVANADSVRTTTGVLRRLRYSYPVSLQGTGCYVASDQLLTLLTLLAPELVRDIKNVRFLSK